MAILDEIRSEILENKELDGYEKICLVALLCSPTMERLEDLSLLMGVTYNAAQMAVRSLRLKGYLKNSELAAEDEEVSALRKLLEREERQVSRVHSSVETAPSFRGEGDSSPEVRGTDGGGHPDLLRYGGAITGETIGDHLSDKSESSRILELTKALNVDVPKNARKMKAAALYKKDSAVAKAARTLKNNSGGEQAEAEVGSVQRELSPEDRVMLLIDESITRSEAAIILGFAGGDYEKVEATYKRIRGTQIRDKVDALVKLLQAD